MKLISALFGESKRPSRRLALDSLDRFETRLMLSGDGTAAVVQTTPPPANGTGSGTTTGTGTGTGTGTTTGGGSTGTNTGGDDDGGDDGGVPPVLVTVAW